MGNRSYTSNSSEFANVGKAVAVVVANEADLGVTDGLYVGTAGNLVVTMANGSDATFTACPAGFHPLRIQKVKNTTAAANIVALYA